MSRLGKSASIVLSESGFPKELIDTLKTHGIYLKDLPIINLSEKPGYEEPDYITLSSKDMIGHRIAHVTVPSGRKVLAFHVNTKKPYSLLRTYSDMFCPEFANRTLQNFEGVLTVFNRHAGETDLWKVGTRGPAVWGKLPKKSGLTSGDDLDCRSVSLLLSKKHPLFEIGAPIIRQ